MTQEYPLIMGALASLAVYKLYSYTLKIGSRNIYLVDEQSGFRKESSQHLIISSLRLDKLKAARFVGF